ncbi:hypothetical protein SAMN05216556_13210 [Aequorivita viscosa]|uniref:SprT-like family protein n=2 Tax=Aequorivita viscosa TaxID=797419 RepID=A0A1M6ND21_9FLAO|nr:hypothetical protein SAMN05216556_13210 [Aequorivita viscosa]SHJ93587.1 hypothetical protein SAMN04487908_13321 [Aequorivita viscosa]
MFDNDFITLEDLINGAYIENGVRTAPCTFASTSSWIWECPNGHTGPGPYGNGTKVCGGNWVITVTNIPCASGGGNGGGGGSGSTQTVIFEICDDLALPGEGNSEDCEDQYADYFTPYMCEDNPNIPFINNWAQNNQQAAGELANYLANNFLNDDEDEDDCAEVDFEHIVILDQEFVDNNCLYYVYEDMGKAPTFNNYLKNFEGTMSVANLRFSSSTSLPSNINATTSAPENYMITITFNENNLDRPSLSVARTMIHEMIHAEIFRKLLSVWQHPSLGGMTVSDLILIKDDYPGLYDYYIRWYNNIPIGINITSAQHQAMAQHYRSIITQAIKEYSNNQYSQDIYDALAWAGLMNTIAWNNLSLSEKNQIIQTINNFENNNPNCQ